MNIEPFVLLAMILSPIATMADGYHHQREYATQRTCHKEIYREKYVAGERSSKGYVKSYLDKVEVPCPSLSWYSQIRKYRPHIHYLYHHTHRRHYKAIRQQVLMLRSYRTSRKSSNSGNATTGGLTGRGLAAAISKKDAYPGSIPLGTLLGIEIANTDC